ncbi:hypothetical protein [Vallitalea guaymasensis]|uniref:hypothetical protein n=1 Tax=Vallitalea guaymasensis TaxID=1185412 RepID=UPI000DE2D9A8|nr:hypothetical protein [Vallitalea guaymasensis]
MNNLLQSFNLNTFFIIALIATICRILCLLYNYGKVNYLKYKYCIMNPHAYLITKSRFKWYGRKIKRNDFISFTIKMRLQGNAEVITKNISGYVVGITSSNQILLRNDNCKSTGYNMLKIPEHSIRMLNNTPFKDVKKIWIYS